MCKYIEENDFENIEAIYSKLCFNGVSKLPTYADSEETAASVFNDFMKVLSELNTKMNVDKCIYVVADLGTTRIGNEENARKWMDYVTKTIDVKFPRSLFDLKHTLYRCFTNNSKLRFMMYTKGRKANEVAAEMNDMEFERFSIRAQPYYASVANVVMPSNGRKPKVCKEIAMKYFMEECDVDVFRAVASIRSETAIVSLVINNDDFKKIKSNDRFPVITMSRFQTFKLPREERYKLFYVKEEDIQELVWITQSRGRIGCLLHNQESNSCFKDRADALKRKRLNKEQKIKQ